MNDYLMITCLFSFVYAEI